MLSLLLSGYLAYRGRRALEVDTQIRIVASHRDLWSQAISEPTLAQLGRPAESLFLRPVSDEEHLFVLLVINHLHSVVMAQDLGVLPRVWGIERDVAFLFSIAVVREVWRQRRHGFEPSFRDFVDRCVKAEGEKEAE